MAVAFVGLEQETLRLHGCIDVEHDAQVAARVHARSHAANESAGLRQTRRKARDGVLEIDDDAIGVIERENAVLGR